MKLITQLSIRKQFGYWPKLKKSPFPRGFPFVENQAHLGYPNLYKLHLHFSVDGIKRWQDHQKIKFPSTCCVSNQPSDDFLPILYRPSWFKKAVPLVFDVPHSKAYYQPPDAMLIAEAPHYFNSFSPPTLKKNSDPLYLHYFHHLTSIVLYGKNKAFLEETLRLNAEEDGDYYPPWIAFPNSMPWDWKQGTPEYWFHYGWAPFINQFSRKAYRDYLQRWDAPEVWIEHNEASEKYADEQ